MRQLPNSQSAEQSLIGSCLHPEYGSESSDRVMFLSPDEFYRREHRIIFGIIKQMRESGVAVDMITVDEELIRIGESESTGEYAYLADMVKSTPSHRNAVAYADIVRDYANKRKIISSMSSHVDDLYSSSKKTLDVLSLASKEIDDVAISCSIGDVLTPDDLIEGSIESMEQSNLGVKAGLNTGIDEVDVRLGDSYLAFGEITVLGGLSKNGKTLLANTITSRLKLDSDEVGHIFSIEMTAVAMFNSIISARTGVPSNFYRKQDFYSKNYPNQYESMHGRWGSAAKELKDSQSLTIDAKKEVDADYICANMKKQAAMARNRGKKLKYVMIDHLHRMNFHNKNEPLTYAIRDAVRKIKNTASELGIAVLLLAQLNNKAEGQDPTSFHILDSSSVRHEMQAFIGIRMYRQDGGTYFGIYADSQRYGDSTTEHGSVFMKLSSGVLTSLSDGENFYPKDEGMQA